ncbi:hypothetical protein [Streptomyces sp. NPDC020983]|uniref:hypothetical protein n=1 Tax=Streptomyces sp. NPDC020983 TaxID=3365106 RepID=UPI003789F6DE
MADPTPAQTPVPTPTPTPAPTPSPDSPPCNGVQRGHSVWVVLAAFAVLGALCSVSLALLRHNPDQLPGVIGAIASPVVAIVSAYLGLKIGNEQGLAGNLAANASRERAEKDVKAILADLPPEQAGRYVHMLGATPRTPPAAAPSAPPPGPKPPSPGPTPPPPSPGTG